jgi:hypothetical protein
VWGSGRRNRDKLEKLGEKVVPVPFNLHVFTHIRTMQIGHI